MFFDKKEGVDIRDIPKKNRGTTFVAKDGYGFVDLTKKKGLPLRAVQTSKSTQTETKAPERSMGNMFGFFDSNVNSASSSTSTNSSTSNSDTDEAVRKVSMQLSDMDSKLYKLEQRIELLERKAGVTNTSSGNSGFSW